MLNFHLDRRSFDGYYEGKKLLHNVGFGNQNATVREFDLLQFEYARQNPCYFPNFDLSVVARNGLHVSTCTAFIDFRNQAAEIEKICTHPEYRRKGLAEVVIRECFKRLWASGIKYAYITGYSEEAKNLYGKMGATKSRNWFQFTLI